MLGRRNRQVRPIERAWRDMRLNVLPHVADAAVDRTGTDEIMLEVIGRSYGL